jgi:hypothetical protein
MSAVLIANPLPAQIVALSSETGDLIAALSSETGDLIAAIEARAAILAQVQDADAYAAADALVGECAKLAKAIEAERKRLKAPIIELGRALDDAAGEAIAPLAAIKAELGRKLLAYEQAENARRAEEARRVAEARAAAEAKARAEQAEADRIRREAEARRIEAEMAQEQMPPSADIAPWDEPAPLPEVPAPAVIVPEYVAPAAPLLKSASVVKKTTRKVEIHDPAQVPREIAGVPLWIIDQKAVEKLAKGGVQIPGVRIVEVETIAAKG